MVDDMALRLMALGISCVRELNTGFNEGWIDLAVRHGDKIASIECKAKPAWRRAVAQALLRCHCADESWICLPFIRGVPEQCSASCAGFGIGILQYEARGTWPFAVLQSAMPEPPNERWRGILDEGYDSWEAFLRPQQTARGGLSLRQETQRVVLGEQQRYRRRGSLTVHRELRGVVTLCGIGTQTNEPIPAVVFANDNHGFGMKDCKKCEQSWGLLPNMRWPGKQRHHMGQATKVA